MLAIIRFFLIQTGLSFFLFYLFFLSSSFSSSYSFPPPSSLCRSHSQIHSVLAMTFAFHSLGSHPAGKSACLMPSYAPSFPASRCFWMGLVLITKSVLLAKSLHCSVLSDLSHIPCLWSWGGANTFWITEINTWEKFRILLPEEGEWMLADPQGANGFLYFILKFLPLHFIYQAPALYQIYNKDKTDKVSDTWSL